MRLCLRTLPHFEWDKENHLADVMRRMEAKDCAPGAPLLLLEQINRLAKKLDIPESAILWSLVFYGPDM